jgi:hypothetical protein
MSNRPTHTICISYAEANVKGQDTSLEIQDITDQSSYSKQIDISASVQVNAITGRGTAKTNFVEQTSVKDDAVYYSVHALVLNGVRFVAPLSQTIHFDKSQQTALLKLIRPGFAVTNANVPVNGARVDLTPHYATLAHDDPLKFRNECGDMFVSAMHEGAELEATFKFDEHERTKKQSITSSIQGSYASVSLDTAVSQKIDEYEKHQAAHLLYHQTGGSGQSAPTDRAGIVRTLQDLPSAATAAPYPFTVTLEYYQTLPSWPGSSQKTAVRDYLKIAGQYGRLRTLWKQADYIKSHPSEYVLGRGVSLDDVKHLQDELKDRLDAIAKAAEKCSKESSESSCYLSDRELVQDYEYRVRMPARKGFDADKELDAAYSNVGDINTKIAFYDNEYRNGGSLGEKIVGGTYADAYRKQLPPAQERLKRAQDAFPAALQDAILEEWVSEPNSSRCGKPFYFHDSTVCVSNARVAELKQKILTK